MSSRIASCVLIAALFQVTTAEPGVSWAGQTLELGPPEDVSLTIYSNGHALIRERRAAKLARGRNRVLVTSLPAGLDSTSIRIEAEGVSLLEILDGSPGSARRSEVGAGQVESGRASRGVPRGQIEAEWILESESKFEGGLTVSYLVPGIQYSASLDVVFEARGGAELDGWISIKNQTGLGYEEARVTLVTVPSRRASNDASPPKKVLRREVELAERVTLAAGQGRRLRVLSRRPTLEPERLVVEGGRLREYDQQLPPAQKLSRGNLGTTPVRAELRRRLRPEDVEALVDALPPLTRRVYRKRGHGSDLLYEDTVDPASMSPDILLHPADGVRAERRQLQFTRRKDPDATEETIELVVANEGDRAARVELVEHLFRSANFEIEVSSRDLDIKQDLGHRVATTSLTIAAGKQAKLTYSVVYRP